MADGFALLETNSSHLKMDVVGKLSRFPLGKKPYFQVLCLSVSFRFRDPAFFFFFLQDLYYLTGFYTIGDSAPQALVLPYDSVNPPFLVARLIECDLVPKLSWISKVGPGDS